jgi:hypothetical protein
MAMALVMAMASGMALVMAMASGMALVMIVQICTILRDKQDLRGQIVRIYTNFSRLAAFLST